MATEPNSVPQVPAEIDREIGERINASTVGIVRLPKHKDNEKPPFIERGDLGGSGTLVSVGDVRGILTASHVIDGLPPSEEIGLCQPLGPQHLHNVRLKRDNLRQISLPRRPGLAESEPPDIAFWIIPPSDAGTIAARSIFFNLPKRKTDVLNPDPNLGSGTNPAIWLAAGFANEWTKYPPPQEMAERNERLFQGTTLSGQAEKTPIKSEFDLYSFFVERHSDYDGPKNFKGYSGGGLWRAILKPGTNSDYVVYKILLFGILFHQSTFLENNINTILCNGPNTVYK